MKIELIEEVREKKIMYSIEVDGKFLSGSVTFDEDEAKELFKLAVERKGIFKKVIETIEIEP